MASSRSEFKGNPTIQLVPDDNPDIKYPFSFGLTKAKLILENLDDIKQFVKEIDPNYEIE